MAWRKRRNYAKNIFPAPPTQQGAGRATPLLSLTPARQATEHRCRCEIQRLYVADARHGKGIAQELMHACIREMEIHGSDVVWLGVWEHNPQAIAFYRKLGFVEVGEHVFPVGNDPQRDIVMARPVAGLAIAHLTTTRKPGDRP